MLYLVFFGNLETSYSMLAFDAFSWTRIYNFATLVPSVLESLFLHAPDYGKVAFQPIWGAAYHTEHPGPFCCLKYAIQSILLQTHFPGIGNGQYPTDGTQIQSPRIQTENYFVEALTRSVDR